MSLSLITHSILCIVEVALQQLTTPSALLTPRTHAVGELAKDYSCVVRNSVSCTACVCVLIVPCVVDRLVSIVLLINSASHSHSSSWSAWVGVALQQLATPSALLTTRTHAVVELAKDCACVVRNSVSCTACVCVNSVSCTAWPRTACAVRHASHN